MSIEIFLDNYSNVCFAGQTISGRVECTFNSNKKLRGNFCARWFKFECSNGEFAISVKFRGRAKTSWTERESYYNYSTKKTEYINVLYYAKETYIDAEYNLIQGAENFSLPPGKHVYPFSYILPTNTPSSFEGKVGNIRYYIKAVVDRPWKFNYKARVPLNFVSLIDLNFIPGLRDPVGLSIDKTLCSCCCSNSGALTFNLSVPITGYVPGQEINIGSYIQNLTNVSVERVQYKVVASYEYIAHHPRQNSKRYSDDVVRCTEGRVGAHGEKSWTSTLLIPTNGIFPNLRSCNIINVNYLLKAKVVLPSPHSNLQLDFPITIGSVALSGVNTTIPGLPAVESTPYLSHNSEPAPFYQHASASAPYLPAVHGLLPYSPPEEASSSYPQKAGWLGPNSKDMTASAPPPSYEESQPQEKI